MRLAIDYALDRDGIVILPPMDVFDSMQILKDAGLHSACTILDPWYNKGIGGELPIEEYDRFIERLLIQSSEVSDRMYLWGFPEIIGPFVRYAPDSFKMTAWLTWYYKNCPCVIRGWRSSQNACLQYVRRDCCLYPEHFLTDEQREKYEGGRMRFVPGQSTVIEAPLLVGFVGKREKTGHPAQKPEEVFEKLILMSTEKGDIVFDPMAGSGTTASSARKHGRRSIVCDGSEEYIQIMENRLGLSRLCL